MNIDLSLINMNKRRSFLKPSDVVFHFYENGVRSITNDEFENYVSTIAQVLAKHSSKGDRVLLLLKPGVDFVVAFFACLYSNRIAVPTIVPNDPHKICENQRTLSILEDAAPTILLTTMQMAAHLKKMLLAKSCKILAIDDLPDYAKEQIEWPAIDSNDTAFLQYTSGSTSRPKGVEISYVNLIDNISIIAKSFNFHENRKGLIWLPPYHDMGLIGGILAPIFNGISLILTPPSTFIRNPLQWLKMISENKINISGGPNFAYELCLKQMQQKPIHDLDLSSWNVAFCGAEPINPDTIEHFYNVFKDYGFSIEAFKPCYGLAENTLITASTLLSRTKSDLISYFDKNLLENNVASKMQDSNSSSNSAKLVCCGSVDEKHEIKIVETNTLQALAMGNVGEIWISGSSVAKGYWNKPADSAKTFILEANGQTKKRWLRTGDLGFLHENNLYITSRIKDIIIFQGKNYYPHDIEIASASSHPSLMQAAAFAMTTEGREQIILLQEVSRRINTSDLELVYYQIRENLTATLDVTVHQIYFIKRGKLPRTSSGKIQRFLCKEMLQHNQFEIIYPAQQNSDHPLELLSSENIEKSILAHMLSHINKSSEDVIDLSLGMLGLDSIQKMNLKLQIEDTWNVVLDEALFTDDQSLAHIIEEVKRNKKIEDSEFQKINLEITEKYALNPSQSMLLLNQMLAPSSSSQNLVNCFILKGIIDITPFKSALIAVINQNINLTSNFIYHEKESYQLIKHNCADSFISIKDYSGISEHIIENELAAAAREPFDLSGGNLVRIIICKIKENHWVLLISMHHIVIDYWSLNSFIEQLMEVYSKPLVNITENINKKRHRSHESNANYLKWYNSYLLSVKYKEDADFWRNYLNKTKLQNDILDEEKTTVASRFVYKLSSELSSGLLEESQRSNISLFKLFISLFHISLSMHKNNSEVIIGTPIALRDWPGAIHHIGYCVNILPIKFSAKTADSLLESIKNYAADLEQLLQHKNFPFSHLVNLLRCSRRNNKLPLCEALFVYHSNHNNKGNQFASFAKKYDISIEKYLDISLEPQVDLMLVVHNDSKENIELVFEFDPSCYSENDIKNLSKHYILLLNQIIKMNTFTMSPILPDIQFKNAMNPSVEKSNILEIANDLNNSHSQTFVEKIKVIWCDVLNINEVNNTDNFFELGGNSLMAVRVADLISKSFSKKIDVRNIFKYQTPAELASNISLATELSKQEPIKKLARVPYKQAV